MRYIEPAEFLLCVRNRENPVSLERGKVYRVVEPESNDPSEYVRIVDESGDDYLFPREWFAPVELTRETVEALALEDNALPSD